MSGDITTTTLRFARRLGNRKFRAAAGEFLVEGRQGVREALRFGAVRRVLATEEAARQFPELVEAGYDRLTTAQARELAETTTPQGIFACCLAHPASLDEVIHDQARLVVFLAQIRDPGNLGTVIRCADAFGADGVVITADSVDLYNPKTVRASVGSIFHLPIVTGVELGSAVAVAQAQGFRVFAADGSGRDLEALVAAGELDDRVGWIMGNEAWGLPGNQLDLADEVVRIPMWGQAESLNLSTAAAVCLYATASRQRATR
ncbi:MAG: RNA methyltransferase [Propionibacteriaceae bacterium]|jgi:TrmH family RNA methyltransferase|nr:RNA methyltransferase [Propionibacteriaceae bacterium]